MSDVEEVVRMGWRGRAGAAAFVIAVLAGCAAPAAPAVAPETTAETAAGGLTREQIIAEIANAEQVVDEFWVRHFSETFPGAYVAPTVVGLYDGTNLDPALPTCAGEPLPPDNAVFCPDGDFVAYDIGLMTTGAAIGDSWIYLIVAHEWGHAIQDQIALDLNDEAAELQADCFAAAALYGAIDDGLLPLDEGDEKEIARSLTEIADETAWTNSADHGDAFERIEAFNYGRLDGVPACLPLSEAEAATTE